MKTKFTCPKCNDGILEKKSFRHYSGWFCSRGKDICGFVIWETISGKLINEHIVTKLLSNGETEFMSGFQSQKGTGLFKAKLKLNKDTWKVEFEFPPDEKSLTDILCPICKTGKMNFYSDRTFCSNEKCKLTIWRKHADRILDDKLMKRLIIKGETPFLFFRSKKGNNFEAKLVLDEKGEIGFIFKNRH